MSETTAATTTPGPVTPADRITHRENLAQLRQDPTLIDVIAQMPAFPRLDTLGGEHSREVRVVNDSSVRVTVNVSRTEERTWISGGTAQSFETVQSATVQPRDTAIVTEPAYTTNAHDDYSGTVTGIEVTAHGLDTVRGFTANLVGGEWTNIRPSTLGTTLAATAGNETLS